VWTMKAATIASAGILAGAAGFIIRDLQLFVVGLVFLSFLAINGFFRPRIRVDRPIPYFKVFEGDLVDLNAFVHNGGARSALIEVYDSVPTQMRIAAGSNHLLVHLPPGEETAMSYTVETPLRGHYVFGPVMLRRRDYSHLFFDEESNTAGTEAYYGDLSSYVKSLGMTLTVGNPGTETSVSYVNVMDVTFIYESAGLPSSAAVNVTV